ncbi:MAG: glycerol-3-phosphate dehydrogenase/oxidase [Vulcanimicrobiaceae bacterium]
MTRETDWQRLSTPCDVLIIGGGITGAGILHEATRRGLRATLVERGDFASATSSRSSKLVHGGLRYLAEGKLGLTRESVIEREALLHAAPGLVDSMPFLMPHYRHRRPGRMELGIGLALYDIFAGRRTHRYVGIEEAERLAPTIATAELTGAHIYTDATTDDARLVLRLIGHACDGGATARNYVEVTSLIRRDGRVVGAEITDVESKRTTSITARAVINATGVFAASFGDDAPTALHLRPLRGSHLLLPDWRLPLAQAIAIKHPSDGRPVFAYPWLGATLVGTTDVDHHDPLSMEPQISRAELAYLMEALRAQFPRSDLRESDIISTYAGVRPVIDDGHANPSKAGRDHIVFTEPGMVTITGGKLTTFRPMALAALRACAPMLAPKTFSIDERPIFTPTTLAASSLSQATRQRLAGRFGPHAAMVVADAREDECHAIGALPFLWAEVRWSARREHVVHLDDLLLRRTRIGLLARNGGAAFLPRIRAICQEELQWDDRRMASEETAYKERIALRYGLPA